MICVVQRVTSASVEIEDNIHNEIKRGLLVLAGICKGDTPEGIKASAKKLIDLRIFSDDNDKMNLSVREINGELLIISQFTLCSDKGKSGNRPSFTSAEDPETANKYYELLIEEIKNYYDPAKIKSGIFAAKMKVNLVNEGPVTIILEK